MRSTITHKDHSKNLRFDNGSTLASPPSLVWSEMKAGDETAFCELYNTFIKDLFSYASRITKNKELIEDSVQDLFVELWKSRDSLTQVKSVKFYLYKRIKRKIIRKLIESRKLPLTRNILEDYNFEITFSYEAELIKKQISKEKQERLLKSLNKLTRRQKEAITLRFFDGLRNSEVAALLAMSPKSVRNLIYRAMIVLKDEMSVVLLLAISEWYIL